MNVQTTAVTAGWLIPSQESIKATKAQITKSDREITQKIETTGCRIGIAGAAVSFITPLLVTLSFGASMACLIALPVVSVATCLFASTMIAKGVVEGREKYTSLRKYFDSTFNNPTVRDKTAQELTSATFKEIFDMQINEKEIQGWDLLAPAYSTFSRTQFAENDADSPKMNSRFTVHYLLPEHCHNKQLQAIKDEFYGSMQQLFNEYREVHASLNAKNVVAREQIEERYKDLKEETTIKIVKWINENEKPAKYTKTRRFPETPSINSPSQIGLSTDDLDFSKAD